MSCWSFFRPVYVLSLALVLSLPLKAQAPAQPLNLPAVASAVACDKLVAADVSGIVGAPTQIKSAAVVNDGRSAAYCKVQVAVDNYAKFELHLPISTWKQRLLFGGGFGTQSPANIGEFVTASWKDLGNRGNEDVFADNYQDRVNFAYRGMHLQVLAAKAIIAKYYHQAPKFSYYTACSEPGREGMMEVERFPEDFDGVAAGCPPLNDVINNGIFYAWNILTNTGADGKPIITADKLPLIHQAVLEQCDAADGLKDGIISDPLNCHPNLSAIECKSGQEAASCLSPAQIHAASELYRGAHDAAGNKLVPIGVLPGSELSWTGVIIPPAANPNRPIFLDDRQGTLLAIRSEFSDPPLPKSFTLADLKWDRATFEAITKLHSLYDATDPDLTPFAKAGHKLILWQALGDTSVLPAHSILYYTALQKQMGNKTVDQFVRFYVLPGVFHCGGGDGPAIKDFLTPLILWVERGIAPGALPAVHVAGGRGGFGPPPDPAAPQPVPDLTRPVYPYPYSAQYTGQGSSKDGANFVKGPARTVPASLYEWLGADFYSPNYEKWCTGIGATFNCKNTR